MGGQTIMHGFSVERTVAMRQCATRMIAVAVVTVAMCGAVRAETVWVNDWDSPAEQRNWADSVTLIKSGTTDYVAGHDLDGNGTYGQVGLSGGTSVWGPVFIEAPAGHRFENIVLTWIGAGGDRAGGGAYTMSVSHLGVFQGEQRTRSTAGSSGQDKLTLDLSGVKEYQGISRVLVRLTGKPSGEHRLPAGPLYMTADVVRWGTDAEVTGAQDKATMPRPYDGAATRSNIVLSWKPGPDAVAKDGHDVYIGMSREQVTHATTSSSGVYRGRQTEAAFDTREYDPKGLTMWQKYYWRIDEVNGQKVTRGDVWSFTVARGGQCIVWPNTDLVINGFTDIEPEIFSLTAYEGAWDFDTGCTDGNGLEFCREYGVEGLGFPSALPGSPVKSWWRDMTDEEFEHWLDDPSGARAQFFQGACVYGGQYRLYGRILPALRKIGVRPMMYAYGPEPPFTGCAGGDEDACVDRWLAASLRYIDFWMEAYPEVEYAHLFGEANARWFNYRRNGKPCGARDYAEFFNIWAAAVRNAHPRLKLGGPVTCWPPTQRDHWEGWCKTMIDLCHQRMDFLDWHSYGPSGTRLEGDIHAVTGYGITKYGKWIRHILSETNNGQNDLTRDEWYDRAVHYRKRVLRVMDQTLRFLRNPDKIFRREFHDYAAWVGTWNVRFKGEGAMAVTPMMELYRIFKPLRGRRVRTENPFEDLMVEAAVDGNRLTVAMANFSREKRRIPLITAGFDRTVVPLSENRLFSTSGRILTADGLADYQVPRSPRDAQVGVFHMPPESLVVAVYTMFRPIEAKEQHNRWEYFADDLMVRFDAGVNNRVSVPVRVSRQVCRDSQSATLRFGINRADNDFPYGRWTVDVDGHEFVLDEGTAFGELRLPKVPDDGVVDATFTCHGPAKKYAVSFVSVVLTGADEYAPPEPAAATSRP